MFWKRRKKRQPRFFISIGAGVNQIPLIKAARNLGYQVIGVDRDSNAPGFLQCDLKVQESIEQYNVIYQKLEEFLVAGTIKGVMTRSYGAAILTTSFLSEKFNTPFIPFNRCESAIYKNKMKKLFTRSGIPTPRIISLNKKFEEKEFDGFPFPVIVKPDKGHAKQNVSLLRSKDELKKYNEHLAPDTKIIFEEYVEGKEIIAAGIVYHGKYHLVQITDKITTGPPHFVDLAHISPSSKKDRSDDLAILGQQICDAYKLEAGPLIMECIVKDNDEILCIEAVPEFGGEFLADVLIPYSTGYNFIRETINATVNGNFNPPPVNKNPKVVAVQYITGDKGILASCNPEGPKRYPDVIFYRIFKDIGSEIKPPSSNLDRVGVVISRGSTPEKAREACEIAIQSLEISLKKQGKRK